MDGDGELRFVAYGYSGTEENRKTSERVKAGRKSAVTTVCFMAMVISPGYDRVGDTYVINEEQAETVRMIYDLYLQG